jgi:hypothetical protein
VLEVLAQRFARGEIDEEQYRSRTATIRAHAPARGRRLAPGLVALAVGVVGLLVLTLFAGPGRVPDRRFQYPGPMHPPRALAVPSGCRTPKVTGVRVDVALYDMGMMGGSGQHRRAPGAPGWRLPMQAVATPGAVAAGPVWLQVQNLGWQPHELLVLPLTDDGGPGERVVGRGGVVDESGALGEAASNCPTRVLPEDAIPAGGFGSVRVDLSPGRYELLCNLPGHYADGMYTELTAR